MQLTPEEDAELEQAINAEWIRRERLMNSKKSSRAECETFNVRFDRLVETIIDPAVTLILPRLTELGYRYEALPSGPDLTINRSAAKLPPILHTYAIRVRHESHFTIQDAALPFIADGPATFSLIFEAQPKSLRIRYSMNVGTEHEEKIHKINAFTSSMVKKRLIAFVLAILAHAEAEK